MEIGRVAYIAVGPDAGKLAVIIDVVDQNRVRIVFKSWHIFGDVVTFGNFTSIPFHRKIF